MWAHADLVRSMLDVLSVMIVHISIFGDGMSEYNARYVLLLRLQNQLTLLPFHEGLLPTATHSGLL